MDHRQAISSQIVERYLLQDLSEAEAETFERHMFSCEECAEDLRMALMVRDAARLVLANEPAPVLVKAGAQVGWREKLAAFWRQPAFAFPALTSAALLVLVFYQSAVLIPAYRRRVQAAETAQAPIAYTLHRQVRGSLQEVSAAHNDVFVLLRVDAAWDAPAPSLRCELLGEEGEGAFSIDTPAPEPGTAVNLLVPASRLKPGRWTLQIRNGPEGELLEQYQFVFNYR